ncbi:hypothetical protein AURANDRAFT_65814 [Aureococcus anophagefferens]|uniref:Uncharacterized protein n=1 Tax=Aureococcus anophagefferens TaxID=44056 RepID=F0YFK7_AURAN|nr:hypothetical protein AURANDRAFT_65814 [Aureococcus anophagefferens]EGB06239.1 hypothetical protein AURANDRAFT_65814 [Aureococcus anophagefferens]|eukprot:XP_009039186.1 hypothetical protein AURANDRAFT_65814 [Aureococcus anophagefferens]
MISVSRVPRVPHSHEAKFRHKANPAVAFPQISAVGRSVAEARYDRRQSARAGRRGSPSWLVSDAAHWGNAGGDPHRRPHTREATLAPPHRGGDAAAQPRRAPPPREAPRPLVAGIAVVERPLSSYGAKRGPDRAPQPLARSLRDREASRLRGAQHQRSDSFMVQGSDAIAPPAKRDVGTAPPAAPPPPAMSPPLASPAPLHSAPQPRVPRRATDTAEERRAARARHDAPGAAHLRPTKSSSRHTIAPLQRSSSRVSDRSRSPPPNFDDADSRRGGQPLDNDAGSDSDEPDDPCESPFYGGLGGLSPW